MSTRSRVITVGGDYKDADSVASSALLQRRKKCRAGSRNEF